ncbi:transketolase [Alphaproteobacteria bacterium]|nr:transketolase [Alphaproteobacteria bacterium]
MSLNTAEAPQEDSDKNLKSMANCIRALSMDAVQVANSGHPGMPMGMADVATVLYSKFLKFDPKNPEWADRDRFILSAGHGSMLLYALNYLTGYEAITLDQIKNFRQLGAITAGHPEYEPHAGIETTTGPLGQGIATAVGMALGERIMNARFGDDLVDHYTYVIAGDGCMQEGISHEACSLAGHLGLNKLIVLYDDNGISIDGSTELSFTDDTPKRFEAYGWDTISVDGHDFDAIEAAIAKAKTSDKPVMIACKTHIGYGAPTKQDSASSHGSPLGEDEIKGARENLEWSHGPFEIPNDLLAAWRHVGHKCDGEFTKWTERLEDHMHRKEFRTALKGDVSGEIAPIIQKLKAEFGSEKPKMATRATSGKVLDALVPAVLELVGGSADLTGSVNTKANDRIVSKENYDGQYIYYGVREHAMAACMNGLAQHGGVIPYSGTFLVFTDYCRPSIRLSALMEQRVVYVMTHDSIGLGEDGPTHQPVEHLASLRAMPNLNVFRPCDGVETAESWEIALNSKKTPSILSLTRQGVSTFCDARDENMVAKGAYILKDCDGEPDVTLFATGSEVEIIMEAADKINGKVRVVSAPCLDLFWQQGGEYVASILCNSSYKIAVEAADRQSWDRIIGGHGGTFIGMNSFGGSAPAPDLYKHFGITAEAVAEAANKKLETK